MLCLGSVVTFAQQPVCKKDPNMPKDAKPAWPESVYTPLEDPACPPCYKYTSKLGHGVMECPFLRFPAEHNQQGTANEPMFAAPGTETRAGNYPPVCRKAPDMPKNAKPAWPESSDYTPLQDPSCPPCYTYTSKLGHEVMECPFLRFPAEHPHQ